MRRRYGNHWPVIMTLRCVCSGEVALDCDDQSILSSILRLRNEPLGAINGYLLHRCPQHHPPLRDIHPIPPYERRDRVQSNQWFI